MCKSGISHAIFLQLLPLLAPVCTSGQLLNRFLSSPSNSCTCLWFWLFFLFEKIFEEGGVFVLRCFISVSVIQVTCSSAKEVFVCCVAWVGLCICCVGNRSGFRQSCYSGSCGGLTELVSIAGAGVTRKHRECTCPPTAQQGSFPLGFQFACCRFRLHVHLLTCFPPFSEVFLPVIPAEAWLLGAHLFPGCLFKSCEVICSSNVHPTEIVLLL